MLRRILGGHSGEQCPFYMRGIVRKSCEKYREAASFLKIIVRKGGGSVDDMKNPPHGRAADHIMQELFFSRKER